MTKTTTPKVSKTTFPTDQPSQQEWFRQFGVASGYTKPTPYYGGNQFNTKVFLGQTRSAGRNLFGKIIHFITNKFIVRTWAN